ncbi:zinc-dependent metalloprotease [Nakamurella endophytica]|uniref:Coenzyme F420 biosynthesis-associated protein n=1 Tax=Nakamurella endophytica TaxID=1748367 RepID=A0A917WGZ8_9ACTN|nr:zinc-dependent metalloprotease [Nakamurella endophytica]GGM04312.1 hypothetical protein GCM10011594_25670 [Nakamurella endophytica]
MADSVIDWEAAVRAGRRLAPTGPAVTPADARQAVADLRSLSARAELVVRDTARLGQGLPVADAVVVDRPAWIAATAEGMELLTEPVVRRLTAQASRVPARAGALAGTQLGAVLAFLSGRVLGQFDPLVDADGPVGRHAAPSPGRLLLVAPNIVKVERELRADPLDFRMWVCLHESTHRLQFTAVPWLRDHFRGLVAEYAEVSDIDPGEMLRRAARAVSARREGRSWIETMQTAEQRAVFDRLMGLMTLLEGHADWVMDAVGPSVVPSVAAIRSRFGERRRRGRGPLDRLLRSLLGMDVKLAQYVHGAAFVAAVVDRLGVDGFNRVWTSPETLPTRAETTDPDAWLARVG